jgi:hypothetical protein
LRRWRSEQYFFIGRWIKQQCTILGDNEIKDASVGKILEQRGQHSACDKHEAAPRFFHFAQRFDG